MGPTDAAEAAEDLRTEWGGHGKMDLGMQRESSGWFLWGGESVLGLLGGQLGLVEPMDGSAERHPTGDENSYLGEDLLRCSPQQIPMKRNSP